MVRIGRLIVIALLVAMLPVKGFAAARMLFCGVNGDRAPIMNHVSHGTMHEPADLTRVAVEPAAHASAGHERAGAAGRDVADTPCHQAVAVSDEPLPVHEGSCSMCAVCTAGTVIASDLVRHVLAPPSFAPQSDRLVSFIGHIPPTPDRPPLS